jgi:predicted regulator of Ras-like GTPase activity (Roadblock/LC7/MglB family)
MSVTVSKADVMKCEEIIREELLAGGAEHVIVVDMSGNLILECGSLKVDDILSLAVLSAANFAATSEIAKLIGEEDFALLFHKGDTMNIHFGKLGRTHIMITLFNDSISLGLIRLKCQSVTQRLLPLVETTEGRVRWHS